MASCLGIYINQNIIKYAKVSREKDDLKIEAFGIKVYSDLHQTIDQIISETFSFKIPISVNMSEETYNYFYMSDLLNKKDLGKAIDTEFESLCYEKQYNPNALESRYALVNDVNEKGKIKVIHVSTNKIKINKITQDFEDKKVQSITPISISIANIAPLEEKENSIILNIEDTTTITTMVGQKVYDIQTLPVGASQILDAISEKENSYLKAYEICKNTTIYTMEGQSLQEKENEYLEDIVPTLYTIATQVRDMISSSLFKINKIYITGTASAINNIDLYIEEIVGGVKCEILKPYFLEDSPKINMKDYIEVNSAIALAMQGLGYGVQNINFSKKSFWENLPELLTADISIGKSKKGGSSSKGKLNIELPKLRTWVSRELAGVVILTVAYAGIAMYINNQIIKKNDEIQTITADINKQISLIETDKKKVDSKTSDYNTLTTNLENATNEMNDRNSYRNVIPVLLSQIMNTIPKEVQLTSIENTSGKKIVINAQSEKYEQLAYFKTLLKSKGILEPTSIVSTAAVKEGNNVKIVIEGDLP